MLELPLTVVQLLELNKLLKQEQDHRDRARRRYQAQHPGAEPKPRKSLQLLQPAYALTRTCRRSPCRHSWPICRSLGGWSCS